MDDWFNRFYKPDLSRIVPKNYMLVDTFYEELKEHIEAAQKRLGADQQLLLYFVTSAGEEIFLSDMGYHGPYLLKLYGVDGKGNSCDILAHFSSVQIILKVIPAIPTENKKRIGFKGEERKLQEDGSG